MPKKIEKSISKFDAETIFRGVNQTNREMHLAMMKIEDKGDVGECLFRHIYDLVHDFFNAQPELDIVKKHKVKVLSRMAVMLSLLSDYAQEQANRWEDERAQVSKSRQKLL